MSRVAIGAAAIVTGWCLSAGTAAADPAPPPPPPGPKTTIDGNGTYTVGTDIVPGNYASAGPVEGGVCYWKRVNDSGLVDNAMTKKPQVVAIDPTDTAFTTTDCQQWQKTDATPPPPAGPGELLGQLGAFIGKGILTGGG